mgnify:CR=1 FL=1
MQKSIGRRAFLAGAAALAAGAGLAQEKKGRKAMNVVILTGSPRKDGNTNTLAARFAEGARAAGHAVFRFDAAEAKVAPCRACNACGMNGPCVIKDDFEALREKLVAADVIAFATPMYYFGFSAQLKAVIDRFYALAGRLHAPKRCVLLMAYADTDARKRGVLVDYYRMLLDYHGWEDAGQIVAPGCWPAGAIVRTDLPQKAYDLGKSL